MRAPSFRLALAEQEQALLVSARARGASVVVALLVACWVGCDVPRAGTNRADSKPVEAMFGVLFGGQIQRRQQIPLVIDPARQVQALRLVASPAPTRALLVEWEWGRAPSGGWVHDSRGRLFQKRRVQVGSAHWKPGERVFERVLQFQPEDGPGIWNIRARVDGQVVLDRPLEVYDPRYPPPALKLAESEP